MRTLLGIAVVLSVANANAADVALPQQPRAAENAFQGAFAGLGGSYGWSTPVNFTTFSQGFLTTDISPHGSSGHAFGGYNLNIGYFLIGLELASRWGSEGAKGSAAITTPISFGSGGRSNYSFSHSSDIGANTALRIGAALDQTMIYFKVGVGAARLSQNHIADERGLFSCTDSTCALSRPGGVQTGTFKAWVPTAMFGVGLEQNYGRFFGRAFAEFEAANQQNHSVELTSAPGALGRASSSMDGPAWTGRAGAAVGIRF